MVRRMSKIREALCLLNSMVKHGEQHSHQSITLFATALNELKLVDTIVKENIELRQQLEASQKISAATAKASEKVYADNFRLFNELKAEKALSEERRLALVGFDEDGTFCSSCGYDARIHSNHEPSCDWVRLCKKD